MMAAIATMLSRRVKKAKKKMLDAGAVSPETAKTAEERGVETFHLQSRLAKQKGIVETADGKFYVKVTA